MVTGKHPHRIEVRPGDPLWEEAVALKRLRAFEYVKRETGLPMDEVQRLYEAGATREGYAFHDFMLRKDIGEGPLLVWLEADKVFAYANLRTTSLCDTEALAGIVPDICFSPGASEEQRNLVIDELLKLARSNRVDVLQITVDGTEAHRLHARDGQLFKATYEWRLE